MGSWVSWILGGVGSTRKSVEIPLPFDLEDDYNIYKHPFFRFVFPLNLSTSQPLCGSSILLQPKVSGGAEVAIVQWGRPFQSRMVFEGG